MANPSDYFSEPPDHKSGGDTSVSLELYVKALKRAYTLRCRRINPHFTGVSGKRDPALRTAARLLMAAGVDPYTYVLFVYDLCSEHMDWVPINMVASSKTVQRFILDRPSREAELQLILASQSDYVRTHLENGERMEEILCDPDAPLSAVFRYAVALTMELQDIANNCKESAEEMLLFEPMYGVLLERLLKCRMSPSNQ